MTVFASSSGALTVSNQVDRLLELGVHRLAGRTDAEFRSNSRVLPSGAPGFVVIHPSVVKPSTLAALLSREGKPGFVVVDMDDLDEFAPIPGAAPPNQPLYLLEDVQRGDDMANWSPEEALAEIVSRGRRPLTVAEGISWLLQDPEQLEPNHCFMTIGSRRTINGAVDSRTPAIWISNGTGRDGRANRGAPKVGWCWARNRHTWLGFASTSSPGQ